ncbi:MAG: isochorismatase family protein [Hyphomonadaceae bacterium]|jgi:nicotinamidase-related amidase|uniref:isochorismatase family protein n=1 Tax=Aquidulcibacter sp. TaxID=2052990 RepID=UPI00262FAB30|nr:isochorismatase family protein [Aquidulcibacter sp.]MCE2890588.1 cysteine hydrolase [Hyphomonadaceae bacterium]
MMYSHSYAYPGPKNQAPPLLICNDLVVDGHLSEEPASWRTCIHNSALILDAARKQGWQIIHAYRQDRAPNPIASLRPQPEEPVFQCRGPSALSSSALRDFLVMSEPEEIILIGRSLVPSCLATAVAAADLGASVTLVADAVSHPIADAQESSRSIAHAAMHLIPQFATMTSTAKLLQLQSSLSLFVSGT